MSHFTVAVFTENGDYDELERALEPFNEQPEEGSEYLEFDPDGTLEDAMREYECNTIEETIKAVKEDGYIVRENEYGMMRNPNAEWDWWTIGGRWEKMLRIVGSDRRVNEAKLSNLDLTPNMEKYNKAIRFWEVVVEGDDIKENENEDDFYTPYNNNYFISMYRDKKNYAEAMSYDFMPFACIDLNGNWHECGSMGWFGCSTATAETRDNFREEYLKYIHKIKDECPDCYITFVDCHI